MLSFQGPGSRLCDGLTRREALRVGGAVALGLSLPGLWGARTARAGASGARGFGAAKSCIVLWMTGGPSQYETWDPKPDCPAEVRGPFQPIATRLAGLDVCQHMPRTASVADKLCVLRGVYTNNPGHSSGAYEMLTGTEHPAGKGNDNIQTSRSDFPTIAAIVKRFRPATSALPTSIVLPQHVANVPQWPGQDGGFMGSEWDPCHFSCDVSAPNFTLPELALLPEVPGPRLVGRRSLLDQVERRLEAWRDGSAVAGVSRHTQQAFEMLVGPRCRDAFDLNRESPELGDGYGRNRFGQGCLLARRLVEAGVGLVQLNWFRPPGDVNLWDSHTNIEKEMRDDLLPTMDAGYSTLLEDLDQRGLLDETLVVWMGEMGRTHKLELVGGRQKEGVGRNHWGGVFSIALAGGGVRRGQVFGASDANGQYPRDGAVTPADLTATFYHLLGIAPETEIRDRLGRPHLLSRGRVIEEVLA